MFMMVTSQDRIQLFLIAASSTESTVLLAVATGCKGTSDCNMDILLINFLEHVIRKLLIGRNNAVSYTHLDVYKRQES